MQVSSQARSCTDRKSLQEGPAGGVRWGWWKRNKPRISSSPSIRLFLSAHTDSWDVRRHTALAVTAKLFLAAPTPPSVPTTAAAERWVCPPVYTSVQSLTRIKLWQPWATLNWPAVRMVRATNYFRGSLQTTGWFFFYDLNRIRGRSGDGGEHEPHVLALLHSGANLHFHISHSGRRLIKNSSYGNIRRASEARDRCSQVQTLNQSDGLSTNYLPEKKRKPWRLPAPFCCGLCVCVCACVGRWHLGKHCVSG